MIALALALVVVQQQQPLERRVAAVRDGTVRFSYAARPGVYGNGRNIISWDCRGGNCRSRQVNGDYSDMDGNDWSSVCDSGPVRIALTVRSGAVTDPALMWGANGGPPRAAPISAPSAPGKRRRICSA